MAVEWVAGSTLAKTTGTSLAAAMPAGIQDGDFVLAFVVARSAITTPSGWTFIRDTDQFGFDWDTFANLEQRIAAYYKTTVTSSDASASVTWSQASAAVLCVAYAVTRKTKEIASSADKLGDFADAYDYQITPNALYATENGQMVIVAASTALIEAGTTTPTAPSGMTLVSGASLSDYRLGVAYQSRETGQGNSGAFQLYDAYNGDNETASITILLEATDVRARVQLETDTVSLLGQPSTRGKIGYVTRAAVESPLQSPFVAAWRNFDLLIAGKPYTYVCDLVLPSSTVRVPITSWQAEMRTEGLSSVNVTIPYATAYVASATAATAVKVYRRVTLNDGSIFEYEMAGGTVSDISSTFGPRTESISLTGEGPQYPLPEDPLTSLDRTLTGIRSYTTTATSMSVKCAVDWTLRPGFRAYVNSTPIVVTEVSYYVAIGDEYMTVRGDI